jgi:choline dehydrogenase
MEADFVIVGSGSAGSALAYRLSEDGCNTVILVEAGGDDKNILVQMPAGFGKLLEKQTYDWGYSSEPEPNLNQRRLAAYRGKVWGGSSSINAMCHVRGHARGYDLWAEAGAAGWAFADVLPYLKRLENVSGGEPGWRGGDGPLNVTRGKLVSPLTAAFLEAGRQAGFETTDDYNGAKQEGFGLMERTVHRGRRWSTANAYLRPALNRANMSLVKGVARRVIFDGRRAVGVEIKAGGAPECIKARREVILCASAYNSPQLLMLSGIGPAGHLREHGIEVLADLPGVGENLQDHPTIHMQYECLKPVSLHGEFGPISELLIGLQWLLFKTGIGASNNVDGAAFVRSRPGIEYPDIEYHFIRAAMAEGGGLADVKDGFQFTFGPMRSKSRGRVSLRSADPADSPRIQFNYMSDPQDWEDFRRCVRLTREIVRQPAFDPYRGREISPGEIIRSDAQIDDFVRDHCFSGAHPCGTVKMGALDDPMAVVDPQTRVIGLEGLRVADSSIFPNILNGNINAASIMTGEKAADHILAKPPLGRSNQAPWINPRWQTSDR